MRNLTGTATTPDEAPLVVGQTGEVAGRWLPSALDPVFPLLLAITDDELAAAAVRVTLALARSKGAIPTVVRAFGEDQESEVIVSPFVGAVAEKLFSPEYRNERRDSLQKRVASIAGDVRWRFEVSDQSPAQAVAELARQLNPGLIVMGLRHHGVAHRAVSRDMLRAVVRSTRLPVLAVRPELLGLPRRIVVAIDFGPASIRAAGLARHLLADDGEMCLVHVASKTPDYGGRRITALRGHGPGWIREEMDRVIEDLSPSARMKMTAVVAEGDVGSSIEACAQRVDADLLAVGSGCHSPLDRILSGSVSMELAHTARWSTLAVPSRYDE